MPFCEIATMLPPHRLSCSCRRCCSFCYASTAMCNLLLLSAFRDCGPGLGTDMLAQGFDAKEDEVRLKASREIVRSSRLTRILMQLRLLRRPALNGLRVEGLCESFCKSEHLKKDRLLSRTEDGRERTWKLKLRGSGGEDFGYTRLWGQDAFVPTPSICCRHSKQTCGVSANGGSQRTC